MSTTFEVSTGDTFESIARKTLGDEKYANTVASANPGVIEPLVIGTSITIPNIPVNPTNLQQQTFSENDEEVAILIDGQRFRYWDTVRIVRTIDSMDIVEFGAPFDSTIQGLRDSFRPFSFKSVVITVGGSPLFTGTMVAVNPVLENDTRLLSVSCYSVPGILNDCTSPASSFPLEFNNQGLREIALSLLEPFGIGVSFDADQGAIFQRVASKPTNKVLKFLIELAKQRNLIISNTEKGDLLFTQSLSNPPFVANFEQGESPLLSVTPFFNPQEYYSHITGMEPVVLGLKGSQYTVKNPRLLGVTRPMTFETSDTLNADVKAAVEAKSSRMFGNTVSYTIRLSTWRDSDGNLWKPNTSIDLTAPDAMVYNKYRFTIRSVEFSRDDSSETAVLNVVIPGSFSGVIPESLPWDE